MRRFADDDALAVGRGGTTATGVRNVIAIAAEMLQTCALEPEGARCWGGHIPDARTGRQMRPDGVRLVPDTRGATRLTSRIGEMCAHWPSGDQRCWSTTHVPLK